jgi:hypothetical protein
MNQSFVNISHILGVSAGVFLLIACSTLSSREESTATDSLPAEIVKQDMSTKVPSATIPPTPKPSPTPTLPPLPTTVMVPRLYTIDLTQGGVVPEDLKEYVYMFTSSAGGCGLCCGGDGTPARWVESYNGATIPALPQTMSWTLMNLQANSPVKVTFSLPDGTSSISELPGDDFGCAMYRYEVVPGTLLGDYSIEFVQGNTIITDSLSLIMPEEPVRKIYEGNEWFAGFEPNEQVTLSLYYAGTLDEFLQPEVALLFIGLPDYSKLLDPFSYRSTVLNAFLGQQTIKADEYGTFQVRYTSEQLNLIDDWGILGSSGGSRITTVAQGDISGLTSVNGFGSICNGSLPTRLAIGDTARVTDYGASSDLRPGEIVSTILGPFCYLSYVPMWGARWEWIVDTPNQTGLQVTECDAEGYYLEPVNP